MSTATIAEVPPKPQPVKRGQPAWNIGLLFPLQGEWTESDYFALETNRLVELSDGCLEVLPVADELHQWMARFLFLLLNEFVTQRQIGEACFAPLPVKLWEGQFREPDVVFVAAGRKRTQRRVPSGADLVMEIVSPGRENRNRDLEVNREEYARAGIPEYWIVDPELKKITVLTLEGDDYREHGVYKEGEQAASRLLDGFAVPVKDVFDVPDLPVE